MRSAFLFFVQSRYMKRPPISAPKKMSVCVMALIVGRRSIAVQPCASV
jgi:hypothetical protein